MTPEQVTQVLAVLKGTYNQKFSVTDATQAAWTIAIGDLDYSMTNKVVYDWITDQEWPPTPAAIRTRVNNLTTEIPGPIDAWLLVQKRIRDTYPGHTMPYWDVPYIVKEATEAIGGLRYIRMSEKPEKMAEQFVHVYKGLIARDDRVRRGEERLDSQNFPPIFGIGEGDGADS